ncbi:MAG TPA: hypothetical protein VFZ65_05845 [Planctomycetota bacterium]|nr:hypothetical protein [Planctomycetota bacterium]
MNPTSPTLLAALGSMLLSPCQPLRAQEPAAHSLADAPAHLPAPADQVLVDATAGGVIWAAGGDWKAGFAVSGMTFVPRLGSDVPSRPIAFALESVRAGEQPLALADAPPSLAGRQRVVYDRGALQERYDLACNGVEQSFVLSALPNRERLTITIAVASGLEHRTTDGGHEFWAAEGGVRYGTAVAIDADGRRLALATAWTGHALEIAVPEHFLATARLPLVVDPLVGTTGIPTTSPKELLATDIAYDHSLQQFYVSYERAYSATDHDVYVAYLSSTMQTQGLYIVDISTESWQRPRIATLEAHDTACVVAQTSTGNVAPFTVQGRIFTIGGAPATVATISPSGFYGGDELAPDVGGDADPVGPSRFLVSFEEKSSAVFGSPTYALYGPTGILAITGHLGSGIYRMRDVAVSKTCGRIGGGTEAWALVNRKVVTGQTTGSLAGWFVNRAGAIVHPVGSSQFFDLTGPTPNAGSEWDVSSPTDHENGRVFLCAETRVDPATGFGSVIGHAFDRLGNLLAGNVSVLGLGSDRHAPAVDSDGCRFVLANTTVFSATDVDVRVNTIALVAGNLVVQDYDVVSVAADADLAPAVCAMPGLGTNDYGLAWIHLDAGQWSPRARRYWGVGPGGFTTRATGCGGLGIFAIGTPALGESFGVTLTGVTGLCGFLAGNPVAWNLPGCIGCTVGVDGQILIGTPLVVQVPTNTTLVGATLALQGLQLLAGPGPCLGQFELSNTLDLTIR